MDFLFIADPLESFAIKKDSTLAMMRAAQAAGHRLWFVETRGIVWKDNSVVADCRPLAIKPSSTSWFEVGAIESRRVSDFSAVFMS